MKVLLADDNAEVRSALRLLLEQDHLPVAVLEASDMQGLLANLSEDCPMVVLLDWELPGLHKSDVSMMLRSRCPGMKVIALSSIFEARREALSKGVDAFISKAEPPEKILYTLRSLIPHITSN
jgi:DNA-binding NarL/FixJ family response regulator